jgi:hypothetical protein
MSSARECTPTLRMIFARCVSTVLVRRSSSERSSLKTSSLMQSLPMRPVPSRRPYAEVHASIRPQSLVIPQASRCDRERCIAAASSGAMSRPRHLINAGRSLPIDNVNQLPRVANEIYLQLPLLIDLELGCGVEHARALTLVRVVQI